jgi:DNA polymerase III alpha subunit
MGFYAPAQLVRDARAMASRCGRSTWREQPRGGRLADRCRAVQRPAGERVRSGGLVLTRQRPGSASGVTFVTLEDETGQVNLWSGSPRP